MALSMNSVGIPGGFRATPDFRENLGFGVVSGDFGGQKAFAQIATTKHLVRGRLLVDSWSVWSISIGNDKNRPKTDPTPTQN